MNAGVVLYLLFVFLNWQQTSAKAAKLRPIKRPKQDSRDKLRLMTSSSSSSSSSSPEDKLQVITKFEFRNATHEERLLAFLFQDYEPVARAVLDVNKSVEVSVSFVLLRIHGLEERNQVLTTTGLIIAEWIDERLVWEPEKFGHVNDVILKSEMVWLPELAVMNGAEELMPDFDRIRILLSHDGQLHWEPGGIFRTTCDIDIAYFPFDVQTCPILIGAYSYYSNRMNISAAIDYISTYGFQENGEWQVENTGATRNLTILDCCPGNGYSHVVFTLQLRRRCRFYLMNIVLPCIMLSTLIMVGFFLPPEAGEKISLGISVLLAFTVFLLMIADNIPRTSLAIPLIVVYLMTTMTLGTISICMTVLVLNVHHRDPRTARLSPLMRSLVLIHTARFLSISTAHSRNFNKKLKRLEAEKACRGRDVQRSGYSPASISNYWKENFQKMSKTKSINGEPLIKDHQNNDGSLKQSGNLSGKQKSPKTHTLASEHRGEARPFTNPSFCMDKPSILSVESDNEWLQAVYPHSKEAKEGMRTGKYQTNSANPFLINNIWKKRHSTGENDVKLTFEEHAYPRTDQNVVKQKQHFQAPQIRANGMLPMSTSCRPDNQHKLTTKNSLNAREDLRVEMIGLSDRSKPIKRLSKSNSSSRQNLKPNNNNNNSNGNNDNNDNNNLRTNTNSGLKQNRDDNQLWCRRRQTDECLDKTNNIDSISYEKSSRISIDMRFRTNISPNLDRKREAEHTSSRKKGCAVAPSEDDDDFNRDGQSLADGEEITIQDEWKDLVRVLDRLFFWLICTLMTLSSLLILLYPMYAPTVHK